MNAPPRLFLLVLISAGTTLGLAGTDLVLPAIPTLPDTLGGTQAMAQYVLAAYVLAKGELFDIILPNMFISNDKELNKILLPLWQKEQMAKIIEDILVNKKNKKDIVDKKKGREVFTKSEIIDLIKKNEPIDNIDKVIKSSREQ